ncbi:hypothetical protein [Deinococcus arcticus]|uniref:hypothetical protein n=1 Tax=Deinococcus arcticus TaxID=2136176 RepID=UPI001304F9FD|nr:hypothetical protein [Deinococcus arcticus]
MARLFLALYLGALSALHVAPAPHTPTLAACTVFAGFLALAFALRRLTLKDVTL